MRRSIQFAAIALPAIALAAISAQAQQSGEHVTDETDGFSEYGFEQMDANGDGIVTRNEYVTYATVRDGTTVERAQELFAEAAGDDDKLTRREFVIPKKNEDGQ